MRYSINAAAVVLLASIVPASAQTSGVVWGGPYGGLDLGADWGQTPGSVRVAPNLASPTGNRLSLTNHSDTTVTGGGQIGYNWQFNNFVLGVEGDIKGGGPSNTTIVNPPGVPGIAPGSSFTASSSVNGSVRGRLGYAIDPFLIYATGGVAIADANLKATYAPTAITPGSAKSGSALLVGPTAGAGVEYALNNNVSLAAEYRYTDYGSERVNLGLVPIVTAGATSTAPVTGRVGLRDNELLFKVNYRFGAPPPPPPMPVATPAPPPSAPKVFIVFFDWDKDTITPEGQQVVQQAADAYKSGAPVQIQVTGYTDRSGSAGYNQRLSERRANNVAKALTRLGVPQNQMVVSGRGENDNRVPTAAGVREPQNRRVEITAP
ncbi:MAG TPA: OmpA family protein [Stellaceae bacterium]|nr:OmpA family protein [Stellaceae bacterium]